MVEPGTLQGAATHFNEKLHQRATKLAPGTAAVTRSHQPLQRWGGMLRLQAPVWPGNFSCSAGQQMRQRDSNSVTTWGAHPVKSYLPSPAFLSLNAANDLKEEL